jgi:hypothetical protein
VEGERGLNGTGTRYWERAVTGLEGRTVPGQGRWQLAGPNIEASGADHGSEMLFGSLRYALQS